MGATEGTGAIDTVDAAGLTLSQVQELSLEEQFDLVRQRDARMRVLITEAQDQVSPDTWKWLSSSLAPMSGANAPGAVPGATRDNSYYLEVTRSIRLPGATGAREDIEPVVAYFESKGWETSVIELGGDRFWAKANTGEGYWVAYTVQPNGQYNLEVFSEMFWGNSRELLAAITNRIPLDVLKMFESKPGVFIPFPEWNDPVRERSH